MFKYFNFKLELKIQIISTKSGHWFSQKNKTEKEEISKECLPFHLYSYGGGFRYGLNFYFA